MDARHSRNSRPRTGGGISPAQVIALGLVAASIGWAAWLLRDRPTSEEVELLPGTVLPSSELAIVEAAFDRAQLSGHRTEEGRVWVPRTRQSAYMRALVDAEALPREFGSSLRRALEQNSPWQSRAVQEESLRVALQEELAQQICSMPGIERAAVLYDVGQRSPVGGSLGAVATQTASVSVCTKQDAELESARVQAIRVLVASSIAGLAPERVAVTDLRSGRVHSGPLTAADDTAAIDPALARRMAHERHLTTKVRQGLAFVKGVVVDVTVTFAAPAEAAPPAPEPVLPPREQRVADANSPAEIDATEAVVADPAPRPATSAAGDPATIVVSLAVPDAWFETAVAAARQRDASAAVPAVERQEEERLRDHVLRLLPPTVRADDRRVVITRFPVGTGRREAVVRSAPAAPAAAPTAAPQQAKGRPTTLGGYIDAAITAVASGKFGDVPREVWVVLSAKMSAIMAYVVFRISSRGQPRAEVGRSNSAAPRRPRAAIDWQALDDDAEDEHDRRGPRMAA